MGACLRMRHLSGQLKCQLNVFNRKKHGKVCLLSARKLIHHGYRADLRYSCTVVELKQYRLGKQKYTGMRISTNLRTKRCAHRCTDNMTEAHRIMPARHVDTHTCS